MTRLERIDATRWYRVRILADDVRLIDEPHILPFGRQRLPARAGARA